MSQTHNIKSTDGTPIYINGDAVTAGGSGGMPLAGHHRSYANPLQTEEISRFRLDSDERLEVHELQVALKGGGTNPSFSVDVFDESTGTVLASTSDAIRGDPLAVSDAGATVLIRVTNETGSAQAASITGDLRKVKA